MPSLFGETHLVLARYPSVESIFDHEMLSEFDKLVVFVTLSERDRRMAHFQTVF